LTEKLVPFFLEGNHRSGGKARHLGVTEVADLEAGRRAAVQQRVLQLQVAMANLLQMHDGFRVGHLFCQHKLNGVLLTLLAEKKKGSIISFFGSYHEVAVAHAANQLLEEVPRLRKNSTAATIYTG